MQQPEQPQPLTLTHTMTPLPNAGERLKKFMEAELLPLLANGNGPQIRMLQSLAPNLLRSVKFTDHDAAQLVAKLDNLIDRAYDAVYGEQPE